MKAFLERAARQIAAGYLLVIDYGFTAREMYLPTRRRGTVLAYFRHQATENLLDRVGRQDITAHVDFTSLAAAAHQCGFDQIGLTSQMTFLLALGLGRRIASLDRPLPARAGTRVGLVDGGAAACHLR